VTVAKRLGEILIERGAITPEGLRSGLEACRRHGGRLGTWLVRLGLIHEGRRRDALTSQTGCPPATTMQLTTALPETRALIPIAFARRNSVVAFARQGRSIDVAMANPNDLLLVDEISRVTGLVPRPHVATEATITAALALTRPAAEASAPAPPPGPPRATGREWRQFWRLESATSELIGALDAPAPAIPSSLAATFPQLQGIERAVAAGPPTGAAGLAEALANASDRDQAADLVLDHLAALAFRVALFSVHQGKVMGWRARGAAIVTEDFHTLILPLDRPSIFLNLTKGVEIHAGRLGGGEGNALLLDALGDPTPAEAVVVPVRVRGKVVAFLWLDQGAEPVAGLSIPLVQEVARLAGLAIEILVLRQKVRAGARLTETVPSD
jgi:hypothetical protein